MSTDIINQISELLVDLGMTNEEATEVSTTLYALIFDLTLSQVLHVDQIAQTSKYVEGKQWDELNNYLATQTFDKQLFGEKFNQNIFNVVEDYFEKMVADAKEEDLPVLKEKLANYFKKYEIAAEPGSVIAPAATVAQPAAPLPVDLQGFAQQSES